MEKTSSELKWSDLEWPADVLVKEVDIEGITENPVFQTKILSSTINRDFLLLSNAGWIKADRLVLVDVILPPINPTPEETKQ